LSETVVIAAAAVTTSREQRDGVKRLAFVVGCLKRGVDVEGGEGVCETRGGKTLFVFGLPPTMVREGVILKTALPIAS